MKSRFLYVLLVSMCILFIFCERNNAKKGPTEDEKAIYLKKGQEVASQSFVALAGKLQQAMKEGGVPNAINYCKTNAMSIIDSLAKVHQCKVRRTTLKARNFENIATVDEELILKDYERKMLAQESLDPIVQRNKKKSISYYAPIKVNAFCLQCHGEMGKTLNADNFAVIKKEYPNDKATGYQEGDLRGMWHVTFLD